MADYFSKSWINMRMQYDDAARSDILINFLRSNSKYDDYNLIDMCSGTGSFLIWLLKNNITFKKNILIDHDIALLKSVKSNFRQYLKDKYIVKSNSNNLNLILTNKHKNSIDVDIEKSDCQKYNLDENQSFIISYSAAIDLMSKSSIANSLSNMKKNNILFYSLCFDGKVKWLPSNHFDKYILSFFNKHQTTDKGFGKALGYQAIDYLTMKAKKLGYEVTKKESTWNIVNFNEKDKYFMRRYVLDIKKALYHMEGIDRSMLSEWYLNKKECIDHKKLKLCVGHKDILVTR